MIALVDCNNFFASCERLFRPDLKQKPVLVLSSNDGCVVARSNEVKDLGIPMGVPYFKVRDIVVKNNVQCFSSNFALYSNMSQRVLSVLSEYAEQIEVYSIDEAFMQLNNLPIQSFHDWGNELRSHIQQYLGMPVSVGVAPTKTLAKLASGYAKKHSQSCVLNPETDKTFYEHVLAETEVGQIWGIGWRRAPDMRRAGIHSALQLAQVSPEWLHSKLGVNGTRLHQELQGTEAHPFESESVPQKSLMASRSFGYDVRSLHELEAAVASFASQAAYKLRRHHQVAGLFGVYLRYKTPDENKKSQSAVTQLLTASSSTTELVTAALQLTRELFDPLFHYKKAGVFAYHLQSDNTQQINMFDTQTSEKRDKDTSLMKTIDEINQRFGSNTIHIGSIDPRQTRWHAKKEKISPAYTTDWSQLPLVHSVK